MKMSDFNVLCQRAWTDPISPYGDVTKLRLTSGSRVELVKDILSQGDLFTILSDMPYGPMGFIADEVTNPVTRSTVKIENTDDVDQAIISFDEDREFSVVSI
jgi:hypothetical protein